MNAVTKRKITKKDKEIKEIQDKQKEFETKVFERLVIKKAKQEEIKATIFLALGLAIAFSAFVLLLVAVGLSLGVWNFWLVVIAAIVGAASGVLINLFLLKENNQKSAKEKAEIYYTNRKKLLDDMNNEEKAMLNDFFKKIKNIEIEKENIIAGVEESKKEIEVPLPSSRQRSSHSRKMSVLP